MPPYLRTVLLTGPREDLDAAMPDYLDYLAAMRERGELRLAGAFARDDGFFELLELKDRRAADASSGEHPLIQLGLVSWSIRAWTEIGSGSEAS